MGISISKPSACSHFPYGNGITTLSFNSGADRARFKQTNTATNLTTYYIGGLYEKQVNAVTGLTTHMHYIKAGGSTIAIYKATETTSNNSNTNTTATELRYLHRDHLGSVTEITDESAAVVERLAYDAWGKRRAQAWTDALAQLSSTQTLRGFTGHEILDVSLIHMNGRVYDPDLGRFLSADPFIQQPANPQSFNRYSYVGNNSLSFTDPSGFFFKKLFKGVGKVFKGIGRFTKKHIRTIAAIGVLFIPGINVYAVGFISGMIASGGDLKAGIIVVWEYSRGQNRRCRWWVCCTSMGRSYFGQWAKIGFGPVAHLATRTQTATLVGGTAIAQGVAGGFAYELGNLTGALIRTGVNRALR